MLTYGEKARGEECYRYEDDIYICIHESVFKYICFIRRKSREQILLTRCIWKNMKLYIIVYSYMHFGVYMKNREQMFLLMCTYKNINTYNVVYVCTFLHKEKEQRANVAIDVYIKDYVHSQNSDSNTYFNTQRQSRGQKSLLVCI